MQEKKNKRLALLLALLVIATAGALWMNTRTDTFEVDKTTFKGFDLKTIDRVTLTRRGTTVLLTYNGSRWRVNDTYDADRQMIDVLFATLQQTEPRRPVAARARDSVFAQLKNDGVKVMLQAGSEPVQTFYAGGDPNRNQAFFSKEDGQPYLMTIPGYRVYVAGIFELPEGGWRNKVVFAFNWRNFQKLAVAFPGRPSNDFTVAFDKDYFNVVGMAQTDTTRLNDYLDQVSLLEVEEYVPTTPALDSLGQTPAVAAITVSDVGQRQYELKLFDPVAGKFYGLVNGSQWAVLPPERAQAVVRPRAFFGK